MSFYLQLFWSFFKIGSFTFGGGYAMIPLIQKEIIDRRGWVSEDEFIELFAFAQASPGPVSLNTAVFVGYKKRGIKGACTALAGTVLPSFAIILAIAVLFSGAERPPIVESAFKGMRPAVVALIAAPLWNFARRMGYGKIILAAATAVVIVFFNISPVYFLIAGAVVGILCGVFEKQKVK